MIKKINQSLYLKIIILLGLSYFIFYSLSFNTQKIMFRKNHFKIIQRNTYNYANLLIDRIESAETEKEKRKLARNYNASLRIIDDQGKQSYPEEFRQLNFQELDRYKLNSMVGFDKGLIAKIQRGNKTYEMILEKKDSSLDYFLFLYRMLTLIYFLIMSIFIYFALRWLLNPINQLHKNVKELTIENLDTPIRTKRTDELGELIHSFNEMKKAIKNMIRSREQLLLDVSHELRTPLTRTNLSLEMLADCEEKEDIIADIREMETMISELLESAKIQSKYGKLELETVNIIDLIEDVALYFENDEPGLDLSQLPEKQLLILDPERIKIVLKNIFSNAIKYSSKSAKPVAVQQETEPGYFVLRVKNYGQGIPEKELDFIFEPFYRVDKSRNKETGGYGLGMHLVKKIIEAHNGKVAIYSVPGEWTEVTVKLPM
ncbi:MAG: sensor histidine kinase [Fidelibacterota bacterium]